VLRGYSAGLIMTPIL